MTLFGFTVIGLAGTLLTLATRRSARIAIPIGIGGLVITTIAAIAIEPGRLDPVAGTSLVTTDYVRLFLILGSILGLGLGLSGLVTGSRRDAPAVTMAILATAGLTLGLRDPQAAVIAATAGGLFGVLVALVPGGGPAGAKAGMREARVVVVAGVLGLAATAWFELDPDVAGLEPAILGLAYLAFGVAVAMRFGAIPFHLWAARLADTVPETALPLLTAIAPAPLAILALAWTEASVTPSSADIGPARIIVIAIALASIVLGALAAFVQDDVEHVVGYSIIGDAGVVILALATLDARAWEPARMWILAMITARSAFAAWSAGIRAGFWTGSLDDLHGWARRSPLLALVLVAVAVASVGLPGFASFDSRTRIVDLALGGPLAGIVAIGTLAPIAYYGRLLSIGLRRPTAVGRPIDDWWPRIPRFERADVPAWVRSTARMNRAVGVAVVAMMLAFVALATSVGSFDAAAAAAARPPTLQRPVVPAETATP